MGKGSGVQWCTASHGFWYGCRRLSPGCAYCFADRDMKWKGKDFNTVARAKGFDAPLKWKDPQRIFVNPWSDFFIEEADEWRDEAMGIVVAAHWHTFLILTKRIDLARDYFEKQPPGGRQQVVVKYAIRFGLNLFDYDGKWPPPNMKLGVSVENQRQADERIPKLLQIPAAKKFVSIEPLLGRVDLSKSLGLAYWEEAATVEIVDGLTQSVIGHRPGKTGWHKISTNYPLLDWVIVGGESGGPEYRRLVAKVCCCGDWKEAHDEKGHCRTCRASRGPLCMKYRFSHWEEKPEAFQWVRSLRDQCVAAGVKFFFKQFGGPRPDSGGRSLDGRTWEEIPDAI